MSQEKVWKTLATLDLSRRDVQVYIYLAKKGPQRARELREALNMQKQQLCTCLTRLQAKGIVISSNKHPAEFSALNFEKVLELLIQTCTEEAKQLTQNKEALLSAWIAMTSNDLGK